MAKNLVLIRVFVYGVDWCWSQKVSVDRVCT